MTAVTRREKANAIRALSMDAVQQANSGHPGAPMGMADIAEVLWSDFMSHNPANPKWPNRDRFVLSNGHGSMLIYSLLHLSGYDLSIDEIRNFRQLHSKTPGHPEYGYTPGVETTTGPLGQGICNAVGMAIGEKTLAAQFSREGHSIIDHFTNVFLGDGCLMEGISHEGCSLAGTLKLGKLIAFYDDNGISIDGQVQGWFTDDTPGRFESYGWHVIRDIDGHDPDSISAAVSKAKEVTDRPSILCCKTIIGFGSPNKAGKESSHGAPLGEEEISLAREELGWSHGSFDIPESIYEGWNAIKVGSELENQWNVALEKYRIEFPELADELDRRLSGKLPKNWSAACDDLVESVVEKAETIASRKASQNALEGLGPILPELIGGSADLAGSNLTIWSGSKGIQNDPAGNYIYYGVREFAMAAIINGLSLYGGFKPYGATFLMFSEYARNALRMAALMKIPSLFVFTHDSVGLGEDGPTHQAVEQTATLRMIPRMSLWRPCDAVESMIAWQEACESVDQPFSLIFSRQNLPHQLRTKDQLKNIARGGYVLKDSEGDPEVIIIATGSEISLAMEVAEQSSNIRVVSMPSTDRFDSQDQQYKDSVLPPAIRKRVAVEAGVGDGWLKYTGFEGAVLSIDTFGESAPAGEVFKHLGMTAENLKSIVENLLLN